MKVILIQKLDWKELILLSVWRSLGKDRVPEVEVVDAD